MISAPARITRRGGVRLAAISNAAGRDRAAVSSNSCWMLSAPVMVRMRQSNASTSRQ
jgi:hypothetical protein